MSEELGIGIRIGNEELGAVDGILTTNVAFGRE